MSYCYMKKVFPTEKEKKMKISQMLQIIPKNLFSWENSTLNRNCREIMSINFICHRIATFYDKIANIYWYSYCWNVCIELFDENFS